MSLTAARIALEAIARVTPDGMVRRWAQDALAEVLEEEARRAPERARGRRRRAAKRADASMQLSLSSGDQIERRDPEGEHERETDPPAPPESGVQLVAKPNCEIAQVEDEAPGPGSRDSKQGHGTANRVTSYDWRPPIATLAAKRPGIDWDHVRAKYVAWASDNGRRDTLSAWLRFAGNERAPPMQQLELPTSMSRPPQRKPWMSDESLYREAQRQAVPMPPELRSILCPQIVKAGQPPERERKVS